MKYEIGNRVLINTDISSKKYYNPFMYRYAGKVMTIASVEIEPEESHPGVYRMLEDRGLWCWSGKDFDMILS